MRVFFNASESCVSLPATIGVMRVRSASKSACALEGSANSGKPGFVTIVSAAGGSGGLVCVEIGVIRSCTMRQHERDPLSQMMSG